MAAFNDARDGKRAERGAVGVTVVHEDELFSDSTVEIADDSICVRYRRCGEHVDTVCLLDLLSSFNLACEAALGEPRKDIA